MLSREELKESIEKCCNYDYNNLTEFISELAHRIKTFGEIEFIREYATKEDLDVSKKYGKPHNCFLVALIEYLCHKNNITIPEVIEAEADIKMDFLLFHEGEAIVYETLEEMEHVEEAYNKAFGEFLKHNLVLGEDVFDVV